MKEEEELKQYRKLLRDDINKLTKRSNKLGWIWIGFSFLTIIASAVLLYCNKKMIDISVILISNAAFLILFVCNVFMLCLLWWRNKTGHFPIEGTKSTNRHDKGNTDSTEKISIA